MIKFTLQCEETHQFESWFRSNDDFQKQSKRGLVDCPICGSSKVEKALMSPTVPKKSNQRPETPSVLAGPPTSSGHAANAQVPMQQGAAVEQAMANAPAEVREKVVEAMREFRDHVMKSTDDVGGKFAEEARAMHFDEKPARPIRGEATAEEVKSLVDDGVPCAPVPVLPEDHN